MSNSVDAGGENVINLTRENIKEAARGLPRKSSADRPRPLAMLQHGSFEGYDSRWQNPQLHRPSTGPSCRSRAPQLGHYPSAYVGRVSWRLQKAISKGNGTAPTRLRF